MVVEEAMLSVKARERVISSWELLEHQHTPKTKWSISNALALELAEHLERTRPERILEIGSGFSTVILAAHAARYEDVRVVSLEHSKRYKEHTQRGLEKLGLTNERVDLKLANLREHKFSERERFLWYDLRAAGIDETFDFVFVDGPPKTHGRWGVLFGLPDYLRSGWEMWVDDGLRQHEQKCLKLWKQQLEFSHVRCDIDGKGLLILRDGKHQDQARSEEQPGQANWAGKVGIGILANGDPSWRQRTQKHLDSRLLRESFVLAASDDASSDSTESFVDEHITRNGQPHKRLVGQVLQSVAQHPGVEYVLLLNDDWSSRTLEEKWLERALEILQKNLHIDQIYLRRRIDQNDRRVHPSADGMGFVERSGALLSQEPCLIRARSLLNGPSGQRRAPRERGSSTIGRLTRVTRRVRSGNSQAVQLSPGVFLEKETGRRRRR
jgi:precorrin-6B methylase 2